MRLSSGRENPVNFMNCVQEIVYQKSPHPQTTEYLLTAKTFTFPHLTALQMSSNLIEFNRNY